MRLDCEYKLIDKTGTKVLYDMRFLSHDREKEGENILEFAKFEGEGLISESKEACNLVHAQFAESFVETK